MVAGTALPHKAIRRLIFLRRLLPAGNPGSRFGPAGIELHSRYLSVFSVFFEAHDRSVQLVSILRRDVVRIVAVATVRTPMGLSPPGMLRNYYNQEIDLP